MTSQNKNGVDSRGILRGTLYRVVSVEMAFSYDNVYILQQGEGEVYILTRQMRAVLRPYQNLGLVSPG